METVVAEIGRVVAILFAAFFGAWSAFQLQSKKEKNDLERRQVEAANKAIFSLIRSYNRFRIYRDQFISPQIDHPIYFLSIPPAIGFDPEEKFVDYESLSFILTDEPNLLASITALEMEVTSTSALIVKRSQIHSEEVQTAVEKTGLLENVEYTKAQIVKAIGPRVYAQMHNMTDAMIQGTEDIIVGVESSVAELNLYMRKRYKGHRILKIDETYLT